MYEQAGGDAGLHLLEDVFDSKVLADPLLRPLFGKRQPHQVDHLTWFTAESFGGPDRFTCELGFDHLVKVHRDLRITGAQLERFVALYPEALDEAGLRNGTPFREAVRSRIEFGARVAQQSSLATSDDELHPLDHVPLWEWEGDDQAGRSSSPAPRARLTAWRAIGTT